MRSNYCSHLRLHLPPLSITSACWLFLLLVFPKAFIHAQGARNSITDSINLISPTVFAPAEQFISGEQNWDVQAEDMNGDGRIDIVTTSKIDGNVNIHLNNGTGLFDEKKSFPSQKQNRALCIFDANQDGSPDVTTITQLGKLCILLNDGNGNLSRPQVLHTGVMAHDLTAVDLNNDGILDIVTAIVSENSLKYHLGKEGGRFGTASPIPTGRNPRSVTSGDLDKDGKPDLIVGCDDGRVYIHKNLGKGVFAPKESFRSGGANWGLGVADLNQDGHLDIATASYLDKKLMVHINKGDGTFEREQWVLSGDHNFDLVIQDFDLDGDLDIVTCSTVDRAISYHVNDGKGNMGPRIERKSGDWNAGIATGDFDGDGDWDVVTASINDDGINVHTNTVYDQAVTARKSAAVSQSRHSIHGVVYDNDNTIVIAKAPVTLKDQNGVTIGTTLTNEVGEFTFSPPENKTYTITLRAQGLPVHTETIYFGNQNLTKEIFLSRPSASYVFGKVIDDRSLRTLAFAKIEIRKDGGDLVKTIQSDDKGNYHCELPYGLNYEIAIFKDDYKDTYEYFDISEQHLAKGLKKEMRLPPADHVPYACIRGQVMDDKTEYYLENTWLLIRDEMGKPVRKMKVSDDGKYEICLPVGKYEFQVRARNYFYLTTYPTTSQVDMELGFEHNVFLNKLVPNATITLENIHFDSNKSTLRESSKSGLDDLVQVMKDHPRMTVEIAGHTDSDATEQYNKNLSQNRARAVVDYMISKSIEPHRLHAIGYGETQPLVANDSEENKQKNRRTEFRVVSVR